MEEEVGRPTVSAIATQPVMTIVNHAGTVTTMIKLSKCMVKHQEAVTRVQEERSETEMLGETAGKTEEHNPLGRSR